MYKTATDFTFFEKRNICLICHSQSGRGMVQDSFTSTAGREYFCLPGFKYSYCEECDYFFINPQPSFQSVDIYYNTHGAMTDEISFEKALREFEQRGRNYKFVKGIGNKIKTICNPLGLEKKFLDFGCNLGFLLHYLSADYECYGIEINESARKFAKNNFKIKDVFSSLESIPSNLKFDIISLCDVIEHLHNPVETIMSLRDKLTSDGKIFLRLPIINGLLFSRHRPWQWKFVYAPYHLSMFSMKSISILAKRSGLEYEIFMDEEIHCIPDVIQLKIADMFPSLTRKIPVINKSLLGPVSRFVSKIFAAYLKKQYPSECCFVSLSA